MPFLRLPFEPDHCHPWRYQPMTRQRYERMVSISPSSHSLLMRSSLNCRQRHLKCTTPDQHRDDANIPGDKTGTQCRRCHASGIHCVPVPSRIQVEGISFRHGQNPSLRASGPRRYGETDLAFPEDQVWVDIPSRCLPSVLFVGRLLTVAVMFEDETARTAGDYQVVAVEPPTRRPDSQSSASLSSQTHPYSRDQMSGYNPQPFLPPAHSLVGRQKLENFDEAFLLRHFRRYLAIWVCIPAGMYRRA